MRNLILTVALATSVVGCAGINRGTGLGGGTVTAGEERTPTTEAGANTDTIATSGSNTTYPTSGSPVR